MDKFIITDLDGTLAEIDGKNYTVEEENKEIIKLVNNNVIIATGRLPKFVKGVCDFLNLSHTFVASNGAVTYLNGKMIDCHYINAISLKPLINYIKRNCNNYCIHIDSLNKHHEFFDDDQNTDIIYSDDKIVRVNVSLESEDKEKVYTFLSNNEIGVEFVKCRRSIDITPKNITKGKAIDNLIKMLNTDEKHIYIVGNDANDLTMFNNKKNTFLIKSETNKHLFSFANHIINSFSELKYYIKED